MADVDCVLDTVLESVDDIEVVADDVTDVVTVELPVEDADDVAVVVRDDVTVLDTDVVSDVEAELVAVEVIVVCSHFRNVPSM